MAMPDSPKGEYVGKPDIVAEALAFQKLSADAFFNQRKREEDALAFQVPEKQWPDDVRTQRQGQTVNGVPLPARPMLSIPILDQPIQQQINTQKNAHLGVQVHPKDEHADDDTAAVLQGIYRDIEVDSRAELGRGWAFDRGVKSGFGVYRARNVFADDTDDPRDQKIVIERILHQSSVFLDPYAQQPDWSDGKRALIVSYVPFDVFKREHPKAKMTSYGDDELSQLATDYPFWINGTGESRAVCVAEYFYTDYKERSWAILADGRFVFEDEAPKDVPVVQAGVRTVQWPVICWAKINAVEVLEGPIVMDCRWIPIFPYPARELQPFQGERRWMGMIEPNADAARLVNYEVSNAVEKDALAPKAPYIGFVGQFKTMRKQWDQANVRNFSTLEADPVMVGGTLAPLPQRNMVSADLSSSLQLVELAKNLVSVGTSTTDAAALEQLAKRRVAKETIAGLANQGDASNSHFLQTFAEVTMQHEARVLLDWIPKVYDRPGRIAQVLGMDNKRRRVMLNAPFVTGPNGQPMPAPEQPQEGQGKVLRYDLSKGKYGYVVEIGKTQKSRMQEGSDAFGQLIAADPQLISLLGDIWMQFQDFPGHTEAAKRLKAMLPQQIKALDEGEAMDPAAAQAQVAQMGQQIEQLTGMLEEAKRIIKEEEVKQAGENARAEMDNATKLKIAEDANRTKERLAAIEANLKKALAMHQAGVDAISREDEQRHEMALAAADAEVAAEEAERGREAASMENAANRQAAAEQEGAEA